MTLFIRSLKQVVPQMGRHPLDELAVQHGEAWLHVGRAATYKGRSLAASPLANPFRIQANCPRGSTIDAYRQWLWTQMQRDGHNPVLDRLCALAARQTDVSLYCWCQQPGPCHGHVIRSAVMWLQSAAGQHVLSQR